MANTKITSRVIADNSVGIDALNVTDGTNGQALVTDGSGSLSFSTIQGYTDSDVETYLDGGTSTPILASFTVGSSYPLKSYDDASQNIGITLDTPFNSINNGGYNTSLFAPLANLTDGYSNAAFGVSVLTALTSGSNNTFFGNFSANSITTASNNTGIGTYTLAVNTASDNTAVGYYALNANTTGTGNTALGTSSLLTTTTGGYNTAVGMNALKDNTAADNTAVGYAALQSTTSGANNTAVGGNSLYANTTGANNTALGYLALDASTTASNNTAVGYAALTANTTGTRNTALGTYAMQAQTAGYDNTAIGYGAMYNANNAALVVRNTAVGNGALYSTTADDTTAIGYNALSSQTSGTRNVAVGVNSGYTTTTGADNTFLGTNAGYSNTTASNNTAVGKDACFSNSTGTKLAALGYQAEKNNEYGYDNVSIGYQANSTASGAGNGVGRITIGTSVTGYGQEWVTFGRGSTRTRVALGTTTWYSDSDERLKENIQTSAAGLSFINDLRPVTFDWKKKGEIDPSLTAYKEGSEDRIKLENNLNRYGFIAQEVKQAIDNHPEVLDNGEIWQEDEMDGTQGVAPTALIPMLVKAVQQLSAKVEELESQIGV